MAITNDGYKNATIGRVVKVSKHNYRGDGYGLVTLECDEWFSMVVVRTWVSNPEDADMLMDRTVIVHDATVYPMPL